MSDYIYRNDDSFVPYPTSEMDEETIISVVSSTRQLEILDVWTHIEPRLFEDYKLTKTSILSDLKDRVDDLISQCMHNIGKAPKRYKVTIMVTLLAFFVSVITLLICLTSPRKGIKITQETSFQNQIVHIEGTPTLFPSQIENISSHFSSSPSSNITNQLPISSSLLSSSPSSDAIQQTSFSPSSLKDFTSSPSIKTLTPQPSMDTLPPSDMYNIPPYHLTSFPTASNPSVLPSNNPNIQPTKVPTFIPIYNPSLHPSMKPTIYDTYIPSNIPSLTPTNNPIFVPTSIPSIRPTISTSIETTTSLYFYVMGDIPLTNFDVKLMQQQIRGLPKDGLFLIHLGDINNIIQNPNCDEWAFQQTHDILLQSKTPVFIVPGDKDVHECSDQERALATWESYFRSFERHWVQPPPDEEHEKGYGYEFPTVERSKDKPIFFAFVQKEVLVLGLHLTGSPIMENQESWDMELLDNVKWVIRQVQIHKEDVRSIVILAHAAPKPHLHQIFTDSISAACQAWQIPILYIHGNGSEFYKKRGDQVVAFDCDYITDVQVDIGRNAPPLKVKVNHSNPHHFSFDRRLDNTGMFE